MIDRSRTLLTAALVCLALSVSVPVSAQDALWGGDLVSKIDSLAEATLLQGPIAALSIGVKRGDHLLLAKGYGLADVENSVPATSQTVYRIGSITKQFTAASVMQLVQEGKIDLDASMTEYLPDFPTQGHTVTIRHLLQHTSGIKSYTGLEAWRPTITVDLSDQELVDLFKNEPFDFAPGEQYAYNNSAFYLLGMIVGEVSGEGYRGYLDAHLWEPLGLTGSSYCDERRIIPGRAEGYQRANGALVNDDYLSMNQPGAAGALCSTVPDLLSWSSALRAGRVVSPASYAQMTTSGTLNDGEDIGYGFGLGVGTTEGNARVSHGGGINGFNTMLAYYPGSDLDVVVLVNTSGPEAGRVAQTIARWALGLEVEEGEPAAAPVTAVAIRLAPEVLASYVGEYELSSTFSIVVTVENGGLFVQATGQGKLGASAESETKFFLSAVDAQFTFTKDDSGTVTGMILHQGGRDQEAEKVR
jgi:CubicO group peptidase (beta-lactamase class C family)